MENKEQAKQNCNMCKNAKMFFGFGNVCLGEKCKGKIIDKDDAICDEYELGGFIEISEGISNIPQMDYAKFE